MPFWSNYENRIDEALTLKGLTLLEFEHNFEW